MRELWQRCSGLLCGLKYQHMLVRIRKMILTADDVADLQIDVVGARRQMIGGHAVAAEQGEVFDVVGRFGLVAVNGIGEADVFAGPARPSEPLGKSLSAAAAAVA